MKEITRTVKVFISEKEMLDFFAEALAPKAKISENKQRTFYYALGNLVGISDAQAVKRANAKAEREGLERITTDEFRKWLPTVLSQFAGDIICSTKK